MFIIEWKHYIWKNRLWIPVFLFCICKFISMQFETVYIDTHFTGNEEYAAFFKQYEGMLSLDKKTQIQQTDEVLGRYVSYANENPAKHYLVNETGWDAWIGNEKTCGGYYVDKNYIYYYVKNDLGEVTFYKTSKTDFTSEVIYKEVNGDRKYKYSTKYLGLINIHNYDNTSMEEWFEENIQNFWVDGNQLFIINGNSIEMVDYVTKDNKLLCIDTTNLDSHEVKCYSESGKSVEGRMYNVRVYNGEKLLLYISENEDCNWILCDYTD